MTAAIETRLGEAKGRIRCAARATSLAEWCPAAPTMSRLAATGGATKSCKLRVRHSTIGLTNQRTNTGSDQTSALDDRPAADGRLIASHRQASFGKLGLFRRSLRLCTASRGKTGIQTRTVRTVSLRSASTRCSPSPKPTTASSCSAILQLWLDNALAVTLRILGTSASRPYTFGRGSSRTAPTCSKSKVFSTPPPRRRAAWRSRRPSARSRR